MTFNEYVKKFCVDRGMWPEQAQSVLKNMQDDKSFGFDSLRWTDHIEGYPQPMMIAFSINIKLAALDFIDKNMPQAFFRPLFVD